MADPAEQGATQARQGVKPASAAGLPASQSEAAGTTCRRDQAGALQLEGAGQGSTTTGRQTRSHVARPPWARCGEDPMTKKAFKATRGPPRA